MRAPVPSVALSDADPQVAHFAQHLHALRMQRLASKQPAASSRRKRLTPKQRAQVLEKTQGRSPICGGLIQGRWVVDHLFAHALGGPSDSANTLPAHPACNRAKWFYVAENLFKISARMGNKRFGMGCKAQNAANSTCYWQVLQRRRPPTSA